MRKQIKLIIRKGKFSKDGKHTIFLQYCYTSKKRAVISTGITIPHIYWDKTLAVSDQRCPLNMDQQKLFSEI